MNRVIAAFAAALLRTAPPVFAKSAEDYYHGAAYRYVEGKIQEAAAEAEEGLRRHPDVTTIQSPVWDPFTNLHE